MRVTPNNAHTAAAAGRGDGRIWLRRLSAAAAAVMLVGLLLTLLQPDLLQAGLRKAERWWSNRAPQAVAGINEKWTIASGTYLRALRTDVPAAPKLVIDVPFKAIRQIYAKRTAALERGILVQGEDDFVKGRIRYADEVLPIKLRLKGDWNDHLAGRKWSFRVRVRKGRQLFGMRRFSLQNPATRGFQAEVLYFAVLREFGVLTPRYSFVDVTLNGEALGLMALEEFFAKELLEHRERRAGVIVRFDERLVWRARDASNGEAVGWGGAFDSYLNAPIDGFASSTIASDPELRRQYALAEGLLRGFVDQTLSGADVFDVQQMGAMLAVADAFGAWHAVAWHNLRFYLNPITLRLEPVAFDGTLQERFTDGISVATDEPLVEVLLREPEIRRHYRQVLQVLDEQLTAGSLQQRLRAAEAELLPLLQTEFRTLGRFPIDYLQPRLTALLANTSPPAPHRVEAQAGTGQWNEARRYPLWLHVGILDSAQAPRLRAEAAIPHPVEIVAVDWVVPAEGTRSQALADAAMLPRRLVARRHGERGERVYLGLRPAPANAVLEVTVRAPGLRASQRYVARPAVAPLTAPPLPQANLASLRELRWLELSREQRRARVRTGEWQVQQLVTLPPGWTLQAEPGTRLRFAPNAGLVVRGALKLRGTAAAPVELTGRDSQSWSGIVVMNAATKSRLEHTLISGTRSFSAGAWVLTGGTTFYRSDVQIVRSQIIDSHGEDALNIVHAGFQLDDVTFANTAADALDADFAEGSVLRSRFVDVGKAAGGDAIDVSGSELRVRDTGFRRVADKALSIGERSIAEADGLRVVAVGTGLAAKDGSSLMLREADIDGASFAGLAAYIKKPEYGPAAIVARNVRIRAAASPVVVQTGSRVELNGRLVETRDVDVAELYDTLMRPGLQP